MTEPRGPYRTVAWLQPDPPLYPGDAGEHTQHHLTLHAAQHAGLHLACLTMTRWVIVYGPDGTVECTWRQTDENGDRDNRWRAVGPEATAAAHAEMAEILTRIRAEAAARRRGHLPH